MITDHYQQRVLTLGTHRFSVRVLLRVYHSSSVYRHVVPSIRYFVSHTCFDGLKFMLQQKGKRK